MQFQFRNYKLHNLICFSSKLNFKNYQLSKKTARSHHIKDNWLYLNLRLWKIKNQLKKNIRLTQWETLSFQRKSGYTLSQLSAVHINLLLNSSVVNSLWSHIVQLLIAFQLKSSFRSVTQIAIGKKKHNSIQLVELFFIRVREDHSPLHSLHLKTTMKCPNFYNVQFFDILNLMKEWKKSTLNNFSLKMKFFSILQKTSDISIKDLIIYGSLVYLIIISLRTQTHPILTYRRTLLSKGTFPIYFSACSLLLPNL